jgi:transposase
MNHMIHIAAVTQLRLDTEGRVYYRRKRAEGKKPLEAIRCLKRRISNASYRQLPADAQVAGTGPGGHCGATQESSAVGLPPQTRRYARQPRPGRPTTTTPSSRPVDNRREPE